VLRGGIECLHKSITYVLNSGLRAILRAINEILTPLQFINGWPYK